MSWQTIFAAMIPEHLLLAGIVLILLLDIISDRPQDVLPVSFIVVAGAALGAFYLHATGYSAAPFPGQFSIAPSSALAKAVVLALCLPVLLISREEFRDSRFHVLLLSSLYGFCLLLSSDSFLTLFLGLELMSIPVYVLVMLAFNRPEATEAALKYLVLGGAATALFLMGASLLYGGTGSLALPGFIAALDSPNTLARAAVILIVVSFFLKAAIVPFHAWAPDAYEAASVPVTAYMATIIKAGVLLAALRLFGVAPVQHPMADILAILPLVSIVWGNLTAMRQPSFRRMIAYSSIAHAGYLFYAFLGEGSTRYEAVLFYVLAYGVMNVLAFACLPAGPTDAEADRLDNMKGLFRRRPFAALMIGIAMLSLAGIPPFPGFVAKFLIFKNVIAAGFTTYAVLGLVGSYLGIYFYLRVIQLMFMSPDAEMPTAGGSRRLALGASLICLAGVLVIGLFPGALIGHL